MDWWSIIAERENDLFAVAAVCDRRRNLRHMLGAHRAPLQAFYSFPNVIERYIVCDVGDTDAWYYDETNFPAFEFLVHLYRIENLFARELRRQPRRQSESFEQTNDRIALRRPQSSFCNGDGAC